MQWSSTALVADPSWQNRERDVKEEKWDLGLIDYLSIL